MSHHVAVFEGGPAGGQVRAMEPDRSLESDKVERGNPPLVVLVAEFLQGEVRMVQYLRHKDKNDRGQWRYTYLPPENG